ncbi:glycosyltransferase family 2 protein [Pedobacter frigoris]|uniref:Glycosyltransferase n=1 Tax=Pedobacter frigoris TaxID=2571272 RepID=A0A4V5NYG4_9SPHI|nr:glycosyltransferase [Pedobacter frigoris]TKC03704.1 glycosyltransferase [Pedobacter frigoris]
MNKVQQDEILVSVCCITYNHQKYISQALEGFLMQDTDFRYEIIIGEDHSTDETRAIIQKYASKYIDVIKLVSHSQNVGAIKNQLSVLEAAKGKYIAMCDGDDFWTDPLKLQKQVDFLESHPDYVICCHHTEVINDRDETIYLKEKPEALEFNYGDVLLGKREETRICSLMMRNLDEVKEIGKQGWYFKTHGSDTLLKLYAMASTGKKIYVLPQVMACYRLHTGGVWSMIDSRVRKKRMVSDFNLMVENFTYSAGLKRELLKFYLRQYFLFDIRNLRLNGALTTIMNLL